MNNPIKEIPKSVLKELNPKNTFSWARHALLDWFIITIFMYLAVTINHFSFYFITLFVIGNRQHALAILGHDGTHYSINKNKTINDFLSDFIAFGLLGLTTSGYRNLHFAHHKNMNTEHDPELMHRSQKAPQWDLPITIPKILKYGFYDIFGFSITDYFGIILNSKPNKNYHYIFITILNVVFTVTFVLLELMVIPILWYTSLITTFMMFFRFRTWLEHQGTDDTHRLKLNWLEGAMLAPHGVWHHYEHHLCSVIPCYNLKYIREYITGKEIITLKDLFQIFEKSYYIKSGSATKVVK